MEISSSDKRYLYVTFSLSTPGTRWRWGEFPEGWDYAGSNDMMRESRQIEDRFSGPLRTRRQMRKHLNQFFTGLKAKGVVKNYKVTDTRSIPDDGKNGLPRGLPP